MGEPIVLPRAMYKAGVPRRVDTPEQYDRAVADGYGDFQFSLPDTTEAESEERAHLLEPPEPTSSGAADGFLGTDAMTSASEVDPAAASGVDAPKRKNPKK